MGHHHKMNWKNLRDVVHLRNKKVNSVEWSKITDKCFKDLIAMKKETTSERQYLVLSLEDINEYLSEETRDTLNQIVFSLRHHREVENCLPPLKGVFVDESYPFYEETLDKVKMHLKQENRKKVTMTSLGGHPMEVMEDIDPKRPHKGICIKLSNREEYISIGHIYNLMSGSSVFNGFHCVIESFPIKGESIMLQIRDNDTGFTHFYQTTKSSLETVVETVL
ncbi:hypothetical protein SP4_43 [Salmonella phage SP4 SHa-2019]|uniref:Uncharacterized protein n=4 Tax=Felixounavirus TaxID=1198140 RepID=A0AAE7SCD7_9CAUD|nr:hypothetical protein BPS15S6_111 [Salmonella phage BPS15S6]QXN66898.1 hypothetical protein SP4_43 [Salmonella phage SP4 SHa-2019]QXN66985.1 hypothetical protein [Salmonella phage SEP1]QXN67140.1 hypothetical protein [Salmonella phage SP2 SHa-2019]